MASLPSYADLAHSTGPGRGAARLLSRVVGFYFTGKSSTVMNDALKQAVDNSFLTYCLPGDDYNTIATKTMIVLFRLVGYYGHFENPGNWKDWSNTVGQDLRWPRLVVTTLLNEFIVARNCYVALYGKRLAPNVLELDRTLCELVDAYIGREQVRCFTMTAMRKQYISDTRAVWKQAMELNPRLLLTNTPKLPPLLRKDWVEFPMIGADQTSHGQNAVPRRRSRSPRRQMRSNDRVRSPVRRVASSGASSNELNIKSKVSDIPPARPSAAGSSTSTVASTPSSSRLSGRPPLRATNLGQKASDEAGPSNVTPLQGTTPQRMRLQRPVTGPKVASQPPVALSRIGASSAANPPAEMGAGNNNPQNSLVQGTHGQSSSSSIQGKKDQVNNDRVSNGTRGQGNNDKGNNGQGHNAPLNQDAERNPTQQNGRPMEYLDIVKTALTETKKFLNHNDLSPAIKGDIMFQVKQYEVVAEYAIEINNRTKGQSPNAATNFQINKYTDIVARAHAVTKRFAEGFGVAPDVYGLIQTQVKQYKIMAAYAQKIEDLMNQ